MLLKTGGGKFLKNSTATGGMIQKNDRGEWAWEFPGKMGIGPGLPGPALD
jgi:hypothetical protein